MKKARRYATFAEAAKATMGIEDEGVGFDEATTFEPVHLANSVVQVEDRSGPSKGQALVDVVAKATRDEWQKERESFIDTLVQTIEGKIKIVGPAQREYVWCADFIGKHYANECPLKKPRAPLSPTRGPKYCHICKRHGHHDTNECFYNA